MYGEGGDRRGGFKPRGGSGGGFGGGFGGGSGGGFAPVNVGEELDVRIEAVGEKGDGIARKRGFVLFVPNTKEGDEVRIRVTKVLRKVGFAEVLGQAQSTPVEEDAPRREEPAVQPAPPAPAPEDTEDFGEESESGSSEESGEEAPSEEGDEDLEAPPLPDDSGDEEEQK
ncbi:MAG: TRAM domain-containing protein [Nanoarchaeota archaeon]|nr:TRAM domain-containing protein [Nanoarchaeota archaeon]